jgi:hypothetical protein
MKKDKLTNAVLTIFCFVSTISVFGQWQQLNGPAGTELDGKYIKNLTECNNVLFAAVVQICLPVRMVQASLPQPTVVQARQKLLRFGLLKREQLFHPFPMYLQELICWVFSSQQIMVVLFQCQIQALAVHGFRLLPFARAICLPEAGKKAFLFLLMSVQAGARLIQA